MIKYSCVIPVAEINDYCLDLVDSIAQCGRKDIEIIIIPNRAEIDLKLNGSLIMASGRVSPAVKRDIGAAAAKGSFLVFLDDDCFVRFDYFDKLDSIAWEETHGVIGGPAISPENSTLFQFASGAIFEGRILSSHRERYLPVNAHSWVDDWPSVNLVIKRDIFLESGGFGNEFWPGEDTAYCEKLKKKGIRIRYVSDLIVFHHRRKNLISHLKQILGYGSYRGKFFRMRMSNSISISFFIPSIFLVYCVFTFTFIFIKSFAPVNFFLINKNENYLLLIPLFVYAFLLIIESMVLSYVRKKFLFFFLIFLFPISHLCYGFYFLKGLIFPSSIKANLR